MGRVAIGTASGDPDSSSNWAMLDRYPFARYDLSFSKEDEAASPLCRTSQGDPFRVSFRFVAPRAISRFYLHVRGGSVLSDNIKNSCRVIAAHRNALLFCLLVPLPVPVEYLSNPATEPFPVFYKQDLFVYTAGDDGRASLKLLPPCLEVDDNGDDDEEAPLSPGERLYNPLAGIIQFSSDCEGLGVLCNDDGDYVVAYLAVGAGIPAVPGADVIAQLCLYFSPDSHWELHGLPICCANSADVSVLFSWSTKRTLAFGSYLCWIDYHRGVLFCEVFQEHLQVKYLRLPVEALRFHKVCMNLYRSVSIVNDDQGRSKMKFVDMRPSRGYGKYPVSDDSMVSVWTLLITEDGNMSWTLDHEFVIRNDEPHISSHFKSPHGPLIFPIFGMEDANTAYFVVGELGCGVKKVLLVSIDLSSGSVKDVFPYLNGAEDLLGGDAHMALHKSNCFEPFLPNEISKFC